MNIIVRSGLAVGVARLWGAGMPACFAQSDYLSRPIRILVPFPAAGAADTIGRLLGERLSTPLGPPIVVDNQPGGSRLRRALLMQPVPGSVSGTVGSQQWNRCS